MANDHLRRRREATLSPSGSGAPMTRAELAEAVNGYLWRTTGRQSGLDVDTIARYERGSTRWPNTAYRDGLRAVLGVEGDADLGFRPTRRGRTVSTARAQAGDARAERASWLREAVAPDTLASSIGLGSDYMDVTRRALLGAAAWSALSLTMPDPTALPGRRIGTEDVAPVQAAVIEFSRADQRHGGGHQLYAITRYLRTEVLPMLDGTYGSQALRRTAFSSASELSYVAGWMAFDDGKHALAQRLFHSSVRLAQEADDPAMAAHTLRAMAHQALELDAPKRALDLAEASVERSRYRAACARERSLLGVVHARALAANDLPGAAGAALLRAEDDLARATPDGEPGRVFFFSEASLAHETGRTLYASADLTGAEAALGHSVAVRARQPFARTHAVTLGYLAEIQASAGRLDQAYATWSDALTAMDGVRSGRARNTVHTMRLALAPARTTNPVAAELDQRAAAYLTAT
ncbi:hypothetical protein [Promicromonospora sp. NPDC090134]|uniref:hypothetical protein n=1 Tax=Promicromonospora sp. NPDC090134 TaxID=3364408 RepID=UPI003825FF93